LLHAFYTCFVNCVLLHAFYTCFAEVRYK